MASDKIRITSLDLFRAIAEEAAAESIDSLNMHRTPKPDGQPGFILRPDPDRVSMKQALIAIAFSGIYLETLIRIAKLDMKKLGLRFLPKNAKEGRYGGKLEEVGIKDQALIEEADRFNNVRDDLIHEAPEELSIGWNPPSRNSKAGDVVAQEEAQKAVDLIRRAQSELAKIYGKKMP